MVARTSAYLISNPDHLRGFDIQQLTLDFKAFLQYYDQTAKQSYKQIYPHQFCEWVESI
jgi:hypothetical protein